MVNQKDVKNAAINAGKEKFNVPCGCPSAKMMDLSKPKDAAENLEGTRSSQLRQWPIQLHLVNPMAPYFQKADLLVSADCVAYSVGDFHKDFLSEKSLAIACPKLDQGQDIYLEKITSLIDDAQINTLTVMTMEVPCCSGLLRLVKEGAVKARRKVPIKSIVVGLRGNIISEDWC